MCQIYTRSLREHGTGFAVKRPMAERAILTGLVTLILLTALAKMGPKLTASFEQIGTIHSVANPSKAIDHRKDEARAAAALASSQGQEQD